MMDHIQGFFAPFAIYAAVLAAHLVCPARRIDGYVRDVQSGALLTYRLNGLLVALLAVAIWAVIGATGVLPFDWLYTHRTSGAAGACALGIAFTLAAVLRAKPTGKRFLADLYFGRLENPRFFGGRVDAKMFLYQVGATMLALNVLSFTAHHLMRYPEAPSPGIVLHAALFLWFVFDYMVFEHVHVYTYDIFAERVGFKLVWGCLTFYPYFYAVGLWVVAGLPDPGTPVPWLVLSAAVFFSGWILARGANMQKYLFKRFPERRFLGLMAPDAVRDGERALLCGGFWGVSRHVNYLGEILMALGLTLALGRPEAFAAWAYPIYYLVLLLPRERADERRCRAKYGALWDEYTGRVPRRIVPGLY